MSSGRVGEALLEVVEQEKCPLVERGVNALNQRRHLDRFTVKEDDGMQVLSGVQSDDKKLV